MELRTLGRTGVKVSAHCLGTMMFGAWGNTDHDDCVRIIHKALDSGINFVDTADIYSRGESEEIVGKALEDRRDQVVLATKVHNAMGDGPNQRGNSRLWIMRAVEDSLRRLGTDYIDLYQLHRPDPATDISESLAALDDLISQGKIRYAGCSTFPAWQVAEAHCVSERRGIAGFVSEQPPYSIFVRAAERDLFGVTQRYGMGVLVWSPLCGGWLTGRYLEDPEAVRRKVERVRVRGEFVARRFDIDRPANRRKLELLEDLAAVADKSGERLAHVAVAFTLAHPAVTSAIVGPRTMDQLDDLLAGADLRLDEEILDAIDEIVPPGGYIEEADLGYQPPWMAVGARRRVSPTSG
jgi:aryl-alcohol dehydrogenase-like predicted oxidoreductase